MSLHDYWKRAEGALRREGVFGPRAIGLLEEWEDHLRSSIEQLLEGGLSQEEAELRAARSLGDPETLASKAAAQVRFSTWQGRNPVGSTLALGFALIICSFVFMGLVGVYLSRANIQLNSHTIELLPLFAHWIPSIIGVSWVIYHWRKNPCGWIGFAMVTLFAGVVLPLLFFSYVPAESEMGKAGFSFGIGVPTLSSIVEMAVCLGASSILLVLSFKPRFCIQRYTG